MKSAINPPHSHPAAVGSLLRDARHRRGWTLSDVAQETRIRNFILEQLETGQYTGVLRGPYGRSFLLQYGAHLGVDVTSHLNALNAEDTFSGVEQHRYLGDHDEFVSRASNEHDANLAEETAEEDASHSRQTWSRPHLEALATFVCSALLVAGALFGFLQLDRQHGQASDRESVTGTESESLRPLAGVIQGSGRALGDASRSTRASASETSSGTPEAPAASLPASGDLVAMDAQPSVTETTSASTRDFDRPPPRAIVVQE